MTITISASGISLDGPLVAGEKVSVSVSGLALAAEDKPTLALLARFPDALLASVELAESETAGTWTGELDTATKQTALFFATARADERRDAALELVAGRVSLARLTVPMANSALCPKPDGSPFASPVYVPVPGPPGTGGDPYDQAPEMDGEASPGTVDEYARGDHRHPSDSSKLDASGLANANGYLSVAGLTTASSVSFGDSSISGPMNSGAALTDTDISDPVSPLGSALAAKADSSILATVATTGDYGDLLNKPTIPAAQIQSDWNQTNSAAVDFIKNKPTIPAAQVNADWNAASGVAQILNKPTIPDVSGKADAASIATAFSTSSTYAVGDYVTHEGLLYKCSTAVSTAGAWNASNWTAVAVTDEMGADTPLPFDAECEYVTVPAGAYIDPDVLAYDASLGVDVTFRLASDTTLENGAFRCGFWTNDQATSFQLYINSQSDLKLIRYYQSIFTVSNSPFIGSFATASIHGTSFSNGTNTTSVNNPGTRLSAPLTFWICAVGGSDNVPAPCINPVDVAAVKFSFSGISLRDLVPVRVGTVGYLYDKISGRLFGSAVGSIPLVPGPDKATPTITTPGRIVELTPAIRYSFASPTPTVSGTSATVASEDRAINDFTVATGITSLTITPPAAVTGRARDFFCRVTLTDSSLPTVTLSGATIDIGASEVEGMTQGVNLLMFTEISSGHWLASRRSAS